ncbi:membrane protein [Vibrio cholerae]|nr:membrane protein [Vibrio cholerae]CSD39331.1 membrane protein [Vibrio cholerae]
MVGIVSAMLTALCLLPYVSGLNDEQLQTLLMPILMSFGLLIAGVVAWCWHLISGKTVNKWQLLLAGLLVLASATGFHGLYQMPL